MAVSTRRQREKAQRRAQILDAARAVFLQKGFLLTTMDEVAAEAELSKGTLYLYFKSKDDLFVALGIDVAQQVADRFQNVLERNLDGLETVAAMMHSYAEFAMTNPLHFRNMAVWLASGHAVDVEAPNYSEYRGTVSKIVGRLVAAIERGQADGTIKPDLDTLRLAGQIWGGLFGICIIRVNSEEFVRRLAQYPDLTNFVEGYIDIIRTGITGRRISE